MPWQGEAPSGPPAFGATEFWETKPRGTAPPKGTFHTWLPSPWLGKGGTLLVGARTQAIGQTGRKWGEPARKGKGQSRATESTGLISPDFTPHNLQSGESVGRSHT